MSGPRRPRLVSALLLGLALSGLAWRAEAQVSFERLDAFVADGVQPISPLAQDSFGNLYGTARLGGLYGYGNVFRIDPTGAMTILHHFNQTDGSNPVALTLTPDGALWGGTTQGGANGMGTLFKIDPFGTFSVVQHFTETAHPYRAGVIFQASDGAVYGTRSASVFKVDAMGFRIIKTFSSETYPTLVGGSDGFFYGTTVVGGPANSGFVFRIDAEGNNLTVPHLFGAPEGCPTGALIQASDGKFYGTTTGCEGGAGGTSSGIVFRFDLGGGGFTSLATLDGPIRPGLVEAAGKLYGANTRGGVNGAGTAFSIDFAGQVTILHTFGPFAVFGLWDGAFPTSPLLPAGDGYLYGAAMDGGLNRAGTLFRICIAPLGCAGSAGTVSSGTYESYWIFRSAPQHPSAGVIQASDGRLYGVGVDQVNNADSGTMFVFDETGAVTSLQSFLSGSRGVPRAAFVEATDGNFYTLTSGSATTLQGGDPTGGPSFAIRANGSGVPDVHNLQAAYPAIASGLIQATDGFLYGTYSAGPCGVGGCHGVVLAVQPGTLTTNVIHAFNCSSDGACDPRGGVIQGADGNLYGTTHIGQTGVFGTVFRMDILGTLTVLHGFSGPDGAYPEAPLLQTPDGSLYGTTAHGGAHDLGTIFKITSAGVFSVVRSFNGADGANPRSGLMRASDGALYGMTSAGGVSGYGTIYKLGSGDQFTSIYSFDYFGDGAYPLGALIQGSDSALYGTASQGGPGDGGTLFRLALASVGPVLENLKVTMTGSGSGTVGSVPSGINCPGTCTAAFDANATVTLTATPASGSAFNGWTGCDTVSGATCTVKLILSRSVNASFITVFPVTAVRAGAGSGRVTSSPAGIDCPTTCSATFPTGTTVTLTAAEDSNSKFGGWTSGNCNTTFAKSCTVTSARTVTVTFNPVFTLTAMKAGSGSGTVTSQPTGINCGATCAASFNSGTVVTLTGAPASGSVLSWSGCDSLPTPTTCSVTMTANRTVTATFDAPRTLTVSRAGSGSGTVTSQPAGITCGADCTEVYSLGTSVTLTAIPDAGALVGWGGCDSVTGPTCTLAMNANRTATVTFTQAFGLTVTRAGNGFGSVTSVPAGIACGGATPDCDEVYAAGTVVTLTATEGAASILTGWTGCNSSAGANCSVTMTANRAVTVTFARADTPTVTVLHGFVADGIEPTSALVRDAQGNLYGAARAGGFYGDGNVFRFDPSGAMAILHHFKDTIDGRNPVALSMTADGTLWGTTTRGGANGWGTLFKIDTLGQFSVVQHFTEGDDDTGRAGVLFQASDGALYGTRSTSIYKVDAAGFQTIKSFNPAATSSPTLIDGSDGFFYGTTKTGGPSNFGFVFRMDGSGNNLSVLHNFTGTECPPFAPLVRASDGFFYGTTVGCTPQAGQGSNAFRIDSAGAFTILHAFDLPTEGTAPAAALVEVNGFLYGATSDGGPGPGRGVAFKMDFAGNVTPLHVFGASGDGAVLRTPLLPAADGWLYSATQGGGIDGTLYRICAQAAGCPRAAGTAPLDTYETFYVFRATPQLPMRALFQASDGRLWGSGVTQLTSADGGNIFALGGGGAVENLSNFNQGNLPLASFMQASDGNLYTTTSHLCGGSCNRSSLVFRYNLAGTTATAGSLSRGLAAGELVSGLTQATNGFLYGTLGSNFQSGGAVVAINPTTLGFSVLHSFICSNDGACDPQGGVIQGADGSFYGTTNSSPNGHGTVFKMDALGGITIVHAFTGADGSHPQAALLQMPDGSLWGTTVDGGANGLGAVFKVTPAGAFTLVYSFTGPDGANPQAGLLRASDGGLYGTTAAGGAGNHGTLFRLNGAGQFLSIYSFGYFLDGGAPMGALIQGFDGALYGTASVGGPGDGGTIFRLAYGPVYETLTVTPGGSGSGTITVNGTIDGALVQRLCSTACTAALDADATVTLTATAGSGSLFAGWSGCDSSSGATCTVRMVLSRTVNASFIGGFTLTVVKVGPGSGHVTSNPAGIDCAVAASPDPACTAAFATGTSVVVTATADPGSLFGGWTGCDQPIGVSSCRVTMSRARTVTVTFNTSVPLTVTKDGSGSGRVTSQPAGVDCGPTCSTNFQSGTSVNLTATAANGSVFGGWSGCDTPANASCTMNMNAARAVTATFTSTFTVTVARSGSGSGRVTSAPAGIDCGSTCVQAFATGTNVVLTAAPVPGSRFTGWSGGGCSGNQTCPVNSAATVTATFDVVPNRTLTVTRTGGGTGTITSVPAGINCGTACSASYPDGTTVTLTAAVGTLSVYKGWAGCDTVSDVTCTLTLTANRSVTVTLKPEFALSTITSGSGSVSVNPAGLGSCGPGCDLYEQGTGVTLTPMPVFGWQFSGWSGACNGAAGCTVSMVKNQSVTATFAALPTFQLLVTVNGAGTVTSTPAGVTCPGNCSPSFVSGMAITLTAAPAPVNGGAFLGWSGAVCGNRRTNATCTVTMTAVQAVTAQFVALPMLTTATTGAGRGTVTASPDGVPCGAGCAFYPRNTVVTLTASPTDEKSMFTSWSGSGCSGTGICGVNMSTSRAVTAAFALTPTYKLSVAVTGAGQVTSTNVTGISCSSGTCAASYLRNTQVVLSAQATPGGAFLGWSVGACSGRGTNATCTVTMTAVQSAAAKFATLPKLTITTAGSGKGTVSPSPDGTPCGTQGCWVYPLNTVVTLTAAPTSNQSVFTSWSGSGCSGTGLCSVNMSTSRAVTATFTPTPKYTLSVIVSGSGQVTSTNVAGIICPGTCSTPYLSRTQVVLSAQPATGGAFLAWSGDVCNGSTDTTCTVTMAAAHRVTATFTKVTLFNLTLTIKGPGSVTRIPGGTSCGTNCFGYTSGTPVTLAAVPTDTQSTFIGWSGACSGTGNCSVTMTAAKAVTATFQSTAPVARITLDPPTASLAVGDAVQFTAVAFDAKGNVVAVSAFDWHSSNGAVASVTPKGGLVTAGSPGTATITASVQGISSVPATVTVAPKNCQPDCIAP